MAKQTEKLKKRFGFSRKRMSIIKNIVLRGVFMEINELRLKKGKELTFEEIKDFGNKLKIIDDLMNECFFFSQSKFGKTSKIGREMYNRQKQISELRSQLDNCIYQIEISGLPENFDLMDIFYGERDYSKIKK